MLKWIYLGQQLASLDEKVVGQWRMYFGLKSKFYLAEVRFYLKKNDYIKGYYSGTCISSIRFSQKKWCTECS